MIGSEIGHYRIVRLLGKGGMGEVYLADDTKLQRQVALKVLDAEVAADPDRRERFAREARAAAALNHPNIVTIHSVEEAGGRAFLTLEYIEGRTLAESLPSGGLPLDRLLAIAIALADAVGAAHQRGITHRDLKPANVMITADGRVKVLDCGLAKLREDLQPAAAAVLPTQALTGEGRIVGTVAYMSPVQAEGRVVDQRSDVFSLGVMLYELAVGERPFKGETPGGERTAVMPVDNPSRFKLFPTVFVSAQWSADGRSIVYMDNRRQTGNLWRQPVAGGTAVQVTRFDSEQIFRFAYTRDGKQLAVSRGSTISDVVLMTSREDSSQAR